MTAALQLRLRERRRARRAALRNRTYGITALNPPTAPREVVPVTTADGTGLRVHAYGPADGDLIVLVHGWTCCLELWNPQINVFADRYRMIAYDQRGHGESELGDTPLTTDLLADDLAAVLDATQPPGRRVILVGHSLGAMAILAWAQRHHRDVGVRAHAVVLSNTASSDLIRRTTVVPFFNRGRRRLPHWLGKLALSAPLAVPPFPLSQWIFRRQVMSLAATGDIARFCVNVVRSCPIWVRARFGLLLADLDLGQAPASLTVPVTVIAGEADNLTPPIQADHIAETLRQVNTPCRQVLFPTGHFGNVETYRDFNDELARVVETTFGSGQERISG